ncbi:Zinc finger BED domain-containing protein 1 [Acipenser ruthenus]|uniref:Zinc finger BED domain-containing protein 1 n=1 Tax=Acipenser ruthenus TaxID=7906 RepID=A0A444UVN6_ACIRT|nr:Zinc finger BED domain-containing protein 1 [Acipenser ruthenus]
MKQTPLQSQNPNSSQCADIITGSSLSPSAASDSFCGSGDSKGKKPKQSQLFDYVTRSKSCSVKRANSITHSIMRVIVKDLRPISLVEGTAFKDLIQFLEPSYQVPSRKYDVDVIKRELATASSIALTTDIWTSIATEAYLSVTAHFITPAWTMKTINLTSKPLTERHTGGNIVAWVEEVLKKFEISPAQVAALVRDNGSNVVSTANKLSELHGWLSVSCAGHSLQLTINNALKNITIERAIGAARSVVEHFKKSELATTALKRKQKQMETPQHTLLQDVPTRWNSSLHMIKRLLEQRWPIVAVLSDPTVKSARAVRHLDLSQDQWSLLNELVSVLQPFETATAYLSGETYVSLSAVPSLIKSVSSLMDLAVKNSSAIKNFKRVAFQQLDQRWKTGILDSSSGLDLESPMISAAILDPQFRHLRFVRKSCSVSTEQIERALCLQGHYVNTSSHYTASATNATDTTRADTSGTATGFHQPPSSSSTTSDAADEEHEGRHESNVLDEEVHSSPRSWNASFQQQPHHSSCNAAVDSCDAGDISDNHENSPDDSEVEPNEPIDLSHPQLVLGRMFMMEGQCTDSSSDSKLAKWFLCIPATSTPSERLFSAAGAIVTRKRASLSPSHADMLVFLHSNLA